MRKSPSDKRRVLGERIYEDKEYLVCLETEIYCEEAGSQEAVSILVASSRITWEEFLIPTDE